METLEVTATHVCDAADMTIDAPERTWLANQQRKRLGFRSKYVPHQGAREKAKRLARMAAAEKKAS